MQIKFLGDTFEYQEAEKRIWELWEQIDAFSPEVDPTRPPFCVVMPPPNVTGILHMGHVLDNLPQDVLTRWHRMRGFAALWIPGTDHAGIATQSVVSKRLAEEGINFKDLGREEFVKKVWDWKEEHGSIIVNQLKRLGCSCDWKRERFTMDEAFNKAVRVAFVEYYKRGFIYKGSRIINWCVSCGTALSNDEVEHENVVGAIWKIKYPLVNPIDDDTYLTVATTRPETMLGDAAIAVHPEDERYTKFIGQEVMLPLTNRIIPVIADSFVEPSFGTGVVKITPSHDPNDYECANRNKLDFFNIIGLDGKLSSHAGVEFEGITVDKARKKVLATLEMLGLLVSEDKHQHSVGHCYRCHKIIEPIVSEQWFVKMRDLANKSTEVVEKHLVQIIPDSEKHDYFHWMETIQDWCISRQLWWGHRIPVYYCRDCNETHVSVDDVKCCRSCGSFQIEQESDVLDTWFSSQLWPFATLGWPEETAELDYWFPNNLLISGRDILFFWDARMIMAALELTNKVPFRQLVLHGLVRDKHGKKLSKSLNNSPNPIELFAKYGTDSVRAALVAKYPLGRQDTKLEDSFFKNGQALIIKIWNASKFIISHSAGKNLQIDSEKLRINAMEDYWILSRLQTIVELHDECLQRNDFVHAFEAIKTFFWKDFCDYYIEIIKPRIRDPLDFAASTVSVLVMQNILKLFHPYIPFLTEEIWQVLIHNELIDRAEQETKTPIALSKWPALAFFQLGNREEVLATFERIFSIVKGIREMRHLLKVPVKERIDIQLVHVDSVNVETTKELYDVISRLALVNSIKEGADSFEAAESKSKATFTFDGGIGFILLPDWIDILVVKQRLEASVSKLHGEVQLNKEKLKSDAFINNAPSEIVDKITKKVRELELSLEQLFLAKSLL